MKIVVLYPVDEIEFFKYEKEFKDAVHNIYRIKVEEWPSKVEVTFEKEGCYIITYSVDILGNDSLRIYIVELDTEFENKNDNALAKFLDNVETLIKA